MLFAWVIPSISHMTTFNLMENVGALVAVNRYSLTRDLFTSKQESYCGLALLFNSPYQLRSIFLRIDWYEHLIFHNIYIIYITLIL